MKKIYSTIFIITIILLCLNTCKYFRPTPAPGDNKSDKNDSNNVELKDIKDFSNTTINYFNIKSFDNSGFKIKEDNTPFMIVDHGPVDVLPSNVTNPTIYVVFSQPVVPLTKLGEPIIKSDIMKIDPPVEGVYRWYGTKLLSFEPKARFMPQKLYKVTINNSLKSLGGKSLTGNNEFMFHTDYLDVISVSPQGEDIPLDKANKIQITFNFPVNTDAIKDYINILNDNKSFSFKISRPKKENWMSDDYLSKTVLLEVNDKFKENSKVNIVVLKGAKSEKDYLGAPEKREKYFWTIKPFRYVDYSAYTYSFPKDENGESNPIYLEFSHPVDKKSLKNNITVSLQVNNIDDYIEVWGNYIKLNNLPVQYNSTYQINIGKNIKDIYGRSLNNDVKIDVTIPDAASYYYFPNVGVRCLEASFQPKIVYEYQNIFDGVWKISRVENPYDNYFSNRENFGFPMNELTPYNFGNVKKNVKHFEVLDLSGYLNKNGKGFVGMSWNFAPEEIPDRIPYNDFQNRILKNIRDSRLYQGFIEWFYTNNKKEYYYLKDNFRYNPAVAKKIRAQLIASGYKLERNKWAKESLMLQVTDLAVTARVSYNKAVIYTSYISTGEPVKDAKVELVNIDSNRTKIEGKSDSNGLCVLNISDFDGMFSFNRDYSCMPKIRVSKDDDKLEFVPNESHNVYHFGVYNTRQPKYADKKYHYTLIFTDRGLYKPGETVSFRGIDRDLYLGNYSSYKGKYYLKVYGSYDDNKSFYEVSGETTESGGFYGSFKIPEDKDPGYYTIKYSREGYDAYCSFQIANFRRLNFQVNSSSPDVTYYNGDELSVTVEASYLSGGALSGANCEYYWTKTPYYFSPVSNNYKSFSFGNDNSYYDYYDYYEYGPSDYDNSETISSGNGKLDSSGKLTVKQKTLGDVKKGLPYSYNFIARVEDIDRQVVQTSKSIIVHPASFYVGLKFASSGEWWSPFVKKGETAKVDYALVDPDGNLFKTSGKNTLKARLYRMEWKIAQQQGVNDRINSRYELVETLENEIKIDLKNPNGTFNISPKECGQYILEVSANDNFNRDALTRLRFYSTGSSWFNWSTENATDINLVTDRNIYKTGDTVKLLVQSSLPKGKYLVTIEREGIFDEKIINLEGSANVIDIPVKDKYTPVFYIAVSSYSLRNSKGPASYYEPDLGKPKGYFGVTTVRVSTSNKEIGLEIIPDKSSYEPGAESEITIKAIYNGKPLKDTEITFMAVDRGVLDLINYHVPNPIPYFYDPNKFPLAVTGGDSRSLLIDPVTYEVKDLQGGDGDEKVKRREDFNPTAVFRAFLKTDEKGIVKLKFKLPDTLTTYRCTAIAVKDDLFGIKEGEIIAQNILNVRTALTRKLRVRDTSFAGVVITNLDGKDHELTVSCDSDILVIENEKSKKVKIPAKSSLEVPFRIAAVKEGVATLTFRTMSDILKEDLVTKITVDKPVIKEVFTTTGKTKVQTNSLTKGFAEEGLIIPSNIAQGYGGLTLSLDSTKMTTLYGSINYLYNYPYLCMEQRSSKIFPLVVFGDRVKPILNINPKNIVEKEIATWAKFQNSDGGFPFWLEDYNPKSDKFISIKIAKLLYFAKQNGYRIPSELNIDNLLNYISKFENYMGDYLKLYSLYVQSLYGRNVLLYANDMYKKGDTLGITGYAFLGLIFNNNGKKDLANECLKRLKNSIKVGTQTIDIQDTYERYYFSSQINDLSLLLMLFDTIEPDSHFIEKIINTLSNRQKAGYWGNTVSTEWVVQSYAQIYKKETGDKTNFIGAVKINGINAVTNTFKGLSYGPYVKDLYFDSGMLKNLQRDKLFPIDFTTDGIGDMYYTLTMRYSLPSEVIMPRDEGFSIFTEIYDLEGNKIDDPEKQLMLGKTYKMKAVVSTSKRRNFVVARIPIPSGAEILDSSFVTTATYDDKNKKDNSKDNNDYYNYYWYYSNRIQNILDNEVQYIFDNFKEGREDVEFLFRVTTPGIYPTPPAIVECMYEEEVFGRSEGKLYIIKP
jgi:uncharacterized protein YfaS (alpha-2-macroglobulin family)